MGSTSLMRSMIFDRFKRLNAQYLLLSQFCAQAERSDKMGDKLTLSNVLDCCIPMLNCLDPSKPDDKMRETAKSLQKNKFIGGFIGMLMRSRFILFRLAGLGFLEFKLVSFAKRELSKTIETIETRMRKEAGQLKTAVQHLNIKQSTQVKNDSTHEPKTLRGDLASRSFRANSLDAAGFSMLINTKLVYYLVSLPFRKLEEIGFSHGVDNNKTLAEDRMIPALKEIVKEFTLPEGALHDLTLRMISHNGGELTLLHAMDAIHGCSTSSQVVDAATSSIHDILMQIHSESEMLAQLKQADFNDFQEAEEKLREDNYQEHLKKEKNDEMARYPQMYGLQPYSSGRNERSAESSRGDEDKTQTTTVTVSSANPVDKEKDLSH